MPSSRKQGIDVDGGAKLPRPLVLEVPVQKAPIPQAVLDHAAANKVEIRDVTGKRYQ